MVKNSFTLLETIISITLLIIVISGFKYSTYYDQRSHKDYMILNDLENKFDTKNYSNFTKSSKTLQIIKNKISIESLTVLKYQFEDENIKIFKYEK